MSEKKAPKKMMLALICWLAGYWGVHRFMTGHTGIGILFLLTGGVFLLGYWYDLIMILTGKFKTADGQSLEEGF